MKIFLNNKTINLFGVSIIEILREELKSIVIMIDNSFSIDNRKQRIRPVILVYILFEMTMLFQTSYQRLGTIVSGVLCVALIFLYLFESQVIKVNVNSSAIFLYIIELMFSSIFALSFNSKLFQLIIYIVLYILLTSLNLVEREKKWIINGYILSGILYAVLIIYSRFNNPSTNVHANIVLFGTKLDPNYVGLPLIVSFSILFYEVLNNEKKIIIYIGFLFVLAFAILLTASRGNMLSLLICIMGNVLGFVCSHCRVWYKKTMTIVVVVSVFILFYNFANKNYSMFIKRILNFSGDDISNGRTALWRQAFDFFWSKPICGGGFETLGKAINMGAHNTYIQILCDSGIIGFFLFFIFIANIIKDSFTYEKKLFICLIGLLVHSFFLGAIASRCFWVSLIMISMVLTGRKTLSDKQFYEMNRCKIIYC